jgi:predicted DNA-binding antitoxin AbrB/MazE fold protein
MRATDDAGGSAMTEMITAIYEKGVLRPLQPLHLRERQQVRIQVVVDNASDPVEIVLAGLAQEGVLTPPQRYSDVTPLSEQERQALAEQLGESQEKPLSEIIIEERGAW